MSLPRFLASPLKGRSSTESGEEVGTEYLDHLPRGMVQIKNLKLVDKAFKLPLVNSAYSEVTRMASPITPYVESTLSKVTPMVEAGYQTIKSQVEEKVVPHIPNNISESVTSHVTTTMESVTAAVEKVDGFACNGIDQLTEKVPQLKDDTPKLIEDTKVRKMSSNVVKYLNIVKDTLNDYISTAADYTASYTAAQVLLKVMDAGLDVVEVFLGKVVRAEESVVVSNVRKIHTTANNIRLSGLKKMGTEEAKKLEEGTVMEALSYMLYMMSSLGLHLNHTDETSDDDKKTPRK